mgnify:CR=1 FL=1
MLCLVQGIVCAGTEVIREKRNFIECAFQLLAVLVAEGINTVPLAQTIRSQVTGVPRGADFLTRLPSSRS